MAGITDRTEGGRVDRKRFRDGDGFVPVSNFVMQSPHLRGVELKLLGVLASHQNPITGKCNPKIETLMKECGVCRAVIQEGLRGLREKGLMRSEPGQRASTYVVADPADWTQILKGHISDSRKRPDSQEKWIAGTSESELSEASHLLLKKNPRKKNVQTVSVLDHRERRAAAKKGTQTSVRRKRSENQERAAKDVGKIIELRYPWPGSEPLAVAELTEIYDAALPAGDDLVAIRTKLFDNLEIWMKLWKQQPDAWIPSLDQWLHDGTWKREPTERERNRAQKGAQREKRSQLQQGLYGGDDGKS